MNEQSWMGLDLIKGRQTTLKAAKFHTSIVVKKVAHPNAHAKERQCIAPGCLKMIDNRNKSGMCQPHFQKLPRGTNK